MKTDPTLPTILVVDDDARQRGTLRSFLAKHGFAVLEAESGEEALDRIDEHDVALVVTDVRMSGLSGIDLFARVRSRRPPIPFLVMTAFADLRDAVAVVRDGAANYLEKPIILDEVLESIRCALGLDQGVDVDEPHPPLPEDLVAESPIMRDLVRELALIAPSDARVLVTGENGTGKEVLADLIHGWSERREGPLLKINCGAIPESLLESELFGHVKGAFTGAAEDRRGLFARACGGTLLLDEVGEMPPALQVRLLRVTEQGTFTPLGGGREERVDVRIVAATNRNLEAEVEAGRFREDLFFRLNTFELHVPPLRSRREDILPLARRFASRFGDSRKKLSPALAAVLNAYDWPGNVRELRNAMERAMLMAKGGDVLLPEHLPPRIRRYGQPPRSSVEDESSPIEDIERLTILQCLKRNGFNRSLTARELGMPRRTLTFKIRRFREAGFAVDPE